MKTRFLSIVMAGMALLAACSQPASKQAPENGTQVKVIFDNAKPRTMPLDLFGEVPEAIVIELGIAQGVPASVSVMLVNRAGKNILFDAGNGNKDSQLMGKLAEAGVKPEAVDYTFITHLHGDHIGGLVKDGQRVFSQAKLYIPATELEAWTNREGGAPQNVATLVKAYEGSLVAFTYTDALPCDIKALPAHGHTPGHTIYQLDNQLIVGDIMHGVALQQVHPEYCARYDMNPEQAIESRKKVLELAKTQGLSLYGMHFPSTEAWVIK